MIRFALAAAALIAAAPAPAASQPQPGETRIRNMGAYLEAVADPQRGVYIRDYRGRWYYARVQENCPRLTGSARLGFMPSPGGYFDRNSALRADGWRCLIASVTESEGPPRHPRG
jgi:hypothetical protein